MPGERGITAGNAMRRFTLAAGLNRRVRLRVRTSLPGLPSNRRTNPGPATHRQPRTHTDLHRNAESHEPPAAQMFQPRPPLPVETPLPPESPQAKHRSRSTREKPPNERPALRIPAGDFAQGRDPRKVRPDIVMQVDRDAICFKSFRSEIGAIVLA